MVMPERYKIQFTYDLICLSTRISVNFGIRRATLDMREVLFNMSPLSVCDVEQITFCDDTLLESPGTGTRKEVEELVSEGKSRDLPGTRSSAALKRGD